MNGYSEHIEDKRLAEIAALEEAAVQKTVLLDSVRRDRDRLAKRLAEVERMLDDAIKAAHRAADAAEKALQR